MGTFLKEHQFSKTCPYPLEIQTIPLNERFISELDCRLVHTESQRAIVGHFTALEARYIQTVTQGWNWQVDKNNSPACAKSLVRLLEQVYDRASEEREVGS